MLELNETKILIGSLAFFVCFISIVFSFLIERKRKIFENVKEKKLSEQDLNIIIDGLKNKTEQKVIDKIRSEIENLNIRTETDGFGPNVYFTLKTIEESLKGHIRRIQMISLFYLYMGSILTGVSLVFLFYSLQNSSIEYRTNNSGIPLDYILVFFLPRISLTLLIQLFSFFFLRLYKSNLNDLKYYQDELINYYYRRASIEMAYLSENKKTIELLILELSKKEKNILIPEGYTTTEIEKEKLSMSSIKENESIINLLKEFLKSRS